MVHVPPRQFEVDDSTASFVSLAPLSKKVWSLTGMMSLDFQENLALSQKSSHLIFFNSISLCLDYSAKVVMTSSGAYFRQSELLSDFWRKQESFSKGLCNFFQPRQCQGKSAPPPSSTHTICCWRKVKLTLLPHRFPINQYSLAHFCNHFYQESFFGKFILAVCWRPSCLTGKWDQCTTLLSLLVVFWHQSGFSWVLLHLSLNNVIFYGHSSSTSCAKQDYCANKLHNLEVSNGSLGSSDTAHNGLLSRKHFQNIYLNQNNLDSDYFYIIRFGCYR